MDYKAKFKELKEIYDKLTYFNQSGNYDLAKSDKLKTEYINERQKNFDYVLSVFKELQEEAEIFYILKQHLEVTYGHIELQILDNETSDITQHRYFNGIPVVRNSEVINKINNWWKKNKVEHYNKIEWHDN